MGIASLGGRRLAGGADKSIEDDDGRTALDHAEDKGQDEIAKLLRG